MTEWREALLGDVLTLQRGFDLTERQSTPGPFSVISSGGPGYSTDVPKVDGPGVITGRKGVLGKVHWSEGPFWPHDTTLWVKDFKGAVPRFVYYLLQTLPLAELDAGAANPTLNRNHAHLLTVRVPDPTTQSAIATTLRGFDDLIENNRRRVAVLDEMARTIYREWFVKFRYPGHEDVPKVNSVLGPIPEGWEVQPLTAFAKVNGSSRKPVSDEIFKYLDITALSEREIGELDAIAGSDAPGRARRVLSPGDTVWATVRPNRRAHALVLSPGDDWIASTGLAVLTPTGVSSAYLFETASTSAFSDWLVGRATGSAYPAVRAKDFEEAMAVVPDHATDHAFAERVTPLHELCWKLRAECAALAGLRDQLLPKLVTGKIDVSTLELDELVAEQVA